MYSITDIMISSKILAKLAMRRKSLKSSGCNYVSCSSTSNSSNSSTLYLNYLCDSF
jgi:hypothetical protein